MNTTLLRIIFFISCFFVYADNNDLVDIKLDNEIKIANNTACSLIRFSIFEQSQKLDLFSDSVIGPYTISSITFKLEEGNNNHKLFDIIYRISCQGVESSYLHIFANNGLWSAELGSNASMYLPLHTDFFSGTEIKDQEILLSNSLALEKPINALSDLLNYFI